MDSSFVVSAIGTTTTDIGTSLTGSIPLILTIFAALVGLGIGLKYVRKWIGKKA